MNTDKIQITVKSVSNAKPLMMKSTEKSFYIHHNKYDFSIFNFI